MDTVEKLERTDKWYLGGGRRLVWTPLHPLHLDAPGLWDEAHWYNAPLAPLFTMTLLDESGREYRFGKPSRLWHPARLLRRWTDDRGEINLTEECALAANDRFVARWSIGNNGDRRRDFHVVLWTSQPVGQSEGWKLTGEGPAIRFLRSLPVRGGGDPFRLACTLELEGSREVVVQASEEVPLLPRWEVTPFVDAMEQRQSLGLGVGLGPGDEEAMVFAALHTQVVLPAHQEKQLSGRFGVAHEAEGGEERPKEAGGPAAFFPPAGREGVEAAAASWREALSAFPRFACSDPWLEGYYRYRSYGLRLFSLPGGEEHYPHPVVCEGPARFRVPISYSAPAHLRETRWLADPSLARGSLRTFIAHQQQDGRFIGHIYPRWLQEESFYHADWAAVEELDDLHPDEEFLAEAYAGLSRYVHYFDEVRDPEGSGLYDIHNHYETGQEYMARYTAVSGEADRIHWGRVFRLKGVDATVYIYRLKRFLARTARRMDRSREAEVLDASADRVRDAVREQLWDPDDAMFYDLDPATGERTRVPAATCFYPYLCDIAGEEHLEGLQAHLLNPEEFWTPWPVPATPMQHPSFDAEARWKGRRMNCPWNGRVWPMVNSHIAEALAATALRTGDAFWRRTTADFISRFVRMLHRDGDPTRPTSYEHYNPFSGTPSLYRGVNDYQHSWVLDLLIRFVAGLRPTAEGLVVDPFPFELEQVRLQGAPVRGHLVDVAREGDQVTVSVDGTGAGSTTLGVPLELPLGRA